MSLTPETILQTLKAIQDPDLHKDIVTLGFVKDVKIQGGSVIIASRTPSIAMARAVYSHRSAVGSPASPVALPGRFLP